MASCVRKDSSSICISTLERTTTNVRRSLTCCGDREGKEAASKQSWMRPRTALDGSRKEGTKGGEAAESFEFLQSRPYADADTQAHRHADIQVHRHTDTDTHTDSSLPLCLSLCLSVSLSLTPLSSYLASAASFMKNACC